jgi:hypothetical protein
MEIRDKMSAPEQVVSHPAKQSVTFCIISSGHVGKVSNLPMPYEGMWHKAI